MCSLEGNFIMEIVMNIESAVVKKNHPYTLRIKTYIPTYSSNRVYEFSFTSVDIDNVSFPFDEKDRDAYIKALKEKFGVGMYKQSAVNKILEEDSQLRVICKQNFENNKRTIASTVNYTGEIGEGILI